MNQDMNRDMNRDMNQESEDVAGAEESLRRHHRHLQRVANHGFWSANEEAEHAFCPFSYEEIRLEAALRAWIRSLDFCSLPPPAPPDDSVLAGLAAQNDWEFGEDEWWEWATWSSCAACHQVSAVACWECRRLVRFCHIPPPEEDAYEEPSAAHRGANPTR